MKTYTRYSLIGLSVGFFIAMLIALTSKLSGLILGRETILLWPSSILFVAFPEADILNSGIFLVAAILNALFYFGVATIIYSLVSGF